MTPDIVASAMAFLFTILILSYLIGDNPGFRLAVHIFVGVTAGYVAAVAWWQVLFPNLIVPLISGSAAARASLAVPLLLTGLLLMKAWPSLSRLGMPAMGMLVGVAAAVAIGGAIRGTLIPQVQTALDAASLERLGSAEGIFNGLLLMVGTITSLAYFQFSARSRADGSLRRPRIVELTAAIGGIFLAITLGVLFAGAYSAALTALIERLQFLASFIGIG
jgi:hypothetical protein